MAPTTIREGRPLSREELREIVRLMNRYGLARFGDEWQIGGSNAWVTGGKRLQELLDKLNYYE
jgi:hypothetical protein